MAFGSGRFPALVLGGASAFFLLMTALAVSFSVVDDELPFSSATREGKSRTVAALAALTEREAARWTPNAPFGHPAWFIDNAPNYQLGILSANARLGTELLDRLGRNRGTSSEDPDLRAAAGYLKFDGRIWLWGNGNVLPQATAESQYELAVRHLDAYNRRLSEGKAVFETRSDNLIDVLDRIALDLGSSADSLRERTFASNAGWFDFRADDVFYGVKGRMYAYRILLDAIGQDFSSIIAEKRAQDVWSSMLRSMEVGAVMNPLIVSNGSQDGLLMPSHLAAQGFYLKLADTQLREMIDILRK